MNYVHGFPVGSKSIKMDGISIPDDAIWTKTGKDGNEVLASIFAGESWPGWVMSGAWSKNEDGNLTNFDAYVEYSNNKEYLEMIGYATTPGTWGEGYVNYAFPILLLDYTQIAFSLQVPVNDTGATADRDILAEFYLRQFKNTTTPAADDQFIKFSIQVREDGLCFTVYHSYDDYSHLLFAGSTYQNGSGFAPTKKVWLCRAIIHPADEVVDSLHMHVYVRYDDTFDTASEATEYELSNSPLDISHLRLEYAYPAFRIRSQHGTYFNEANSFHTYYVQVIYPPFVTEYECPSSGYRTGDVRIWDELSQEWPHWQQVTDRNYDFIGELNMRNGFINAKTRVTKDERKDDIDLYVWYGSDWHLFWSFDSLKRSAPNHIRIDEINSERGKFTLVWNDGDETSITLERGKLWAEVETTVFDVDTDRYENYENTQESYNTAYSLDTQYRGTQFQLDVDVPGGTYGNLETIQIWVRKTGTPGANLTGSIREDDGSDKPALTTLCTFSISEASVGTSFEWELVTLDCPQLRVGKKYWIVLNKVGSSGNTYEWRVHNTLAGLTRAYSGDDITWTGTKGRHCFKLDFNIKVQYELTQYMWGKADDIVAMAGRPTDVRLYSWNREHENRGNPWTTEYVASEILEYGHVGTIASHTDGVGFQRVGDYGTLRLQEKCALTVDKDNNYYTMERIIDNDNEETDPNVLYDDDESFWSVFQSDAGSYGFTLSEETTIKKKGTSSQKVTVGSGSYGRGGVIHTYGSGQDWTSYDFICIWFYGANTGDSCRAGILSGPSDYYLWSFIENFSGWKRFVFPLRDPDLTGGTLNMSAITDVGVYTYPSGTGAWYLDRTVIDVGKWAKFEVYTVDYLDQSYKDKHIELEVWQGSAWEIADKFGEDGLTAWNYQVYKLLDGHFMHDIYGVADGAQRYKMVAFYFKGERGTVPTSDHTDYCEEIFYKDWGGCVTRYGFALKMPPHDGLDSEAGGDSASTGISQIRIRLKFLYEDRVHVEDDYLLEYEGLATYELSTENNDSIYWDLAGMTQNWINIHEDVATAYSCTLIMTKKPVNVYVSSDEDQVLRRIKIIFNEKPKIFLSPWAGDCRNLNHFGTNGKDYPEDIAVNAMYNWTRRRQR